MFEENQSILDGCKVNIAKWRTRRISIHRTTKMISTLIKGRLCFYIEKGTIWTQTSPQNMVFKIGKISTTKRVQEIQCRQG